MKKCYNFTKRVGRKNLILSVVALILTVIMVVGSTYSWIENITAVQITNQPPKGTGDDTATLGIDTDISETIKLGSCGADDNGDSKFVKVDLGAYFKESGGMHLTTCSGNGDSFMFKSLKGSANAKPWRIGTEDDENVNYISATFKICSPDAEVDMWFDEVPTVGGADDNINDIARYSITVDGETNVYSKSGSAYNHIINANDTDGTKISTVSTRKTAEYTYYTKNDENNVNNPNNENVLFRVGQEPKEVTIRIWLQNTKDTEYDYTGIKTNINMVLSSTWAKTRTITVRDCTSQNKDEYWMSSSDDARVYVALATDPGKYHWKVNWDNKNHVGTVEIPSYYYTGDKICVIRRSSDWGTDTTDNVEWRPGIKCWNYWETELPKGFEDLEFNVVGNTPTTQDKNGQTIQSDTGYSFWGKAERITVYDNAGLTHDNDEKKNRLLVRDADTGNYYPLWDTGSGWAGYVPRTSDKLEFLYKSGNGFQWNEINSKNLTSNKDTCYANEKPEFSWGYTNKEKQTRPYEDKTYIIMSKTSGTWEDLTESPYRLSDHFTGTKLYVDPNNSNKAFAYRTLEENRIYQFKVKEIADSNKIYSNDGVMCYSEDGKKGNVRYPMTEDKKNTNLLLISLGAGEYKIELDMTNNMNLSVDYPTADDSGGRVYLVVKSGFDGYTKKVQLYDGDNGWGQQEMKHYDDQVYNGWHTYYYDYSGIPNYVQFYSVDSDSSKNDQTNKLSLNNNFSRYYIN